MPKKKINFWYWAKGNNFGDMLNIPILKHMSKGKIQFNYVSKYSHGKLLAVGSILRKLNINDIVWGAGAIKKEYINIPFGVKILAIRGPLTKKMLRLQCKIPYGDPGLLMPEIYIPVELNKKYDIGIIPHYIDDNLMQVKDNNILMINVKANYKEIINKINSCNLIISSSLHGILISEAYNKPVIWVKSPSGKIIGHSFKFNDYFLSTNRDSRKPTEWNNISKIINDKNILPKGSIDLKPLKKAWSEYFG